MNIFAVDSDPVKCAIYLDNKRLVKMVLETCQLLSTAINVNGGNGPYKTTHINHPCSIWVRENTSNYQWTLCHFKALLSEYTRRYGKIHKCQNYLDIFNNNIALFKDSSLTTHPNCTTFKDVTDVHEAYKLYMDEKWSNDKYKPNWDIKVR